MSMYPKMQHSGENEEQFSMQRKPKKSESSICTYSMVFYTFTPCFSFSLNR